MTDCERFERWLDEGMPESTPAGSGRMAVVPAEAVAHAAACARCGTALAAARELDTALARACAAAPAGFAERVMERVARAREARLAVLAESDAMPWWVRAAAEPAAAIALALAALVLWQRAALSRFSASALQALGDPAVAAFVRRLAEPRFALDLSLFANPLVLAGVMFAMLPLAWWAGLVVYHWSGDPQSAPHFSRVGVSRTARS